MKSIITLWFLLMCSIGFAQLAVGVKVSADTADVGELVQLTYTIENGEGRFEPPNLIDVPVVSGPNTSSSFIISNGRKSSSISYSYVLRPERGGTITIPKTYYEEKGERIPIQAVDIVVIDGNGRPATPSKPTIKSSSEKRKF